MVGARINICQMNKQRNGLRFLEIASMVTCLLDGNDPVILVKGHEDSVPFSASVTLCAAHTLKEEL